MRVGRRGGNRLIWLFILSCLPLSGCFEPKYVNTFELSVDLNDQGVRRQASSVVKETITGGSYLWRYQGISSTIRGEGALVSLGDGSVIVFSLRAYGRSREDGSRFLAGQWSPSASYTGGGTWDGVRNDTLAALSRERVGPPQALRLDQLPVVVGYKDPTNPKTAYLISPEDLASGRPVKLLRATLTKVSKKPASTLPQSLPWLPASSEAERAGERDVARRYQSSIRDFYSSDLSQGLPERAARTP